MWGISCGFRGFENQVERLNNVLQYYAIGNENPIDWRKDAMRKSHVAMALASVIAGVSSAAANPYWSWQLPVIVASPPPIIILPQRPPLDPPCVGARRDFCAPLPNQYDFERREIYGEYW
jgi:hypothetical protein